MYTLNINGKDYSVNSDPKTPLLWVLRDELGLTGTKYGCGVEICSACTVWIDGSAEKSCGDDGAGSYVGKKIVTIEGLSPTPGNPTHKVQLEWIASQVPQCGYCQSGMIMRVAKLVQGTSKPTDAQIDAAIGNICACGTYPRVRAAIKKMTGQAV